MKWNIKNNLFMEKGSGRGAVAGVACGGTGPGGTARTGKGRCIGDVGERKLATSAERKRRSREEIEADGLNPFIFGDRVNDRRK